jgi:hypothetical protein
MNTDDFYYPKAAIAKNSLCPHGPVYTVKIEGRDYAACQKAAETYWNASSIFVEPDPKDPHQVPRRLLLSEMAVAKLFRYPLPISFLKAQGDHDIKFGDYTVEIIADTFDPATFVIQHQDSDLSTLVLDKDFYIFARIDEDGCRARKALVTIMGWIKPSMLRGRAEVQSLDRDSAATWWMIHAELMGDITALRARKLKAFGDGLKESGETAKELQRAAESLAHTLHGSIVEDDAMAALES